MISKDEKRNLKVTFSKLIGQDRIMWTGGYGSHCQRLYSRQLRHRIPTIDHIFQVNFMFSVYNAVGLASFDLYDDIEFNQWLTSHLLQELQNKHTK